MYGKVRILAFVSIFIFLFVGLAYADPVTVVAPNGGEEYVSGKVNYILLKFDYSSLASPIAKYKLFYKKDGVWRLITIRNCRITGGNLCPDSYPWEVPFVSKTIKSKVKAVVYGVAGNKLGKDISDGPFKILPFSGIPYLTITPLSATVEPGDFTGYAVTGWKKPYTVTTSAPAITTINGTPPPVVLPELGSVFTVENTLSAPCEDTTVTITVTDSSGSTVTAYYIIDCP